MTGDTTHPIHCREGAKRPSGSEPVVGIQNEPTGEPLQSESKLPCAVIIYRCSAPRLLTRPSTQVQTCLGPQPNGLGHCMETRDADHVTDLRKVRTQINDNVGPWIEYFCQLYDATKHGTGSREHLNKTLRRPDISLPRKKQFLQKNFDILLAAEDDDRVCERLRFDFHEEQTLYVAEAALTVEAVTGRSLNGKRVLMEKKLTINSAVHGFLMMNDLVMFACVSTTDYLEFWKKKDLDVEDEECKTWPNKYVIDYAKSNTYTGTRGAKHAKSELNKLQGDKKGDEKWIKNTELFIQLYSVIVCGKFSCNGKKPLEGTSRHELWKASPRCKNYGNWHRYVLIHDGSGLGLTDKKYDKFSLDEWLLMVAYRRKRLAEDMRKYGLGNDAINLMQASLKQCLLKSRSKHRVNVYENPVRVNNDGFSTSRSPAYTFWEHVRRDMYTLGWTNYGYRLHNILETHSPQGIPKQRAGEDLSEENNVICFMRSMFVIKYFHKHQNLIEEGRRMFSDAFLEHRDLDIVNQLGRIATNLTPDTDRIKKTFTDYKELSEKNEKELFAIFKHAFIGYMWIPFGALHHAGDNDNGELDTQTKGRIEQYMQLEAILSTKAR